PARKRAGLVSLRSLRIVDLAGNIPTLAPLFGRLLLTIGFRISRHVWNVAKTRRGTASHKGCRSGRWKSTDCRNRQRKNGDQSDSSDKKPANEDSPLSEWRGDEGSTMLRPRWPSNAKPLFVVMLALTVAASTHAMPLSHDTSGTHE